MASAPLWWGGAARTARDESPDVSFQAAPDSPGTGYRAVVTAPGWKVDYVSQDDKYGGEVQLRERRADRSRSRGTPRRPTRATSRTASTSYPDPPAPGDPVEVLGVAGQLWAYSNTDHTVMREPDQGHWMEFRGSGMDRAAFEELLTQLRLVSLAEFESALPSSFVTAADRPAAVQAILDGIEGVTGVTVPAGTTLDTKSDEQDPYQLGADIAGQYACAWIAEFADATSSGTRRVPTRPRGSWGPRGSGRCCRRWTPRATTPRSCGSTPTPWRRARCRRGTPRGSAACLAHLPTPQ